MIRMCKHTLNIFDCKFSVLQHFNGTRLNTVSIAFGRAMLTIEYGLIVVSWIANICITEWNQFNVHVSIQLFIRRRQLTQKESLTIGTKCFIVDRDLRHNLWPMYTHKKYERKERLIWIWIDEIRVGQQKNSLNFLQIYFI